jgi:transcriptional regulator with XRE-family HTH domain
MTPLQNRFNRARKLSGLSYRRIAKQSGAQFHAVWRYAIGGTIGSNHLERLLTWMLEVERQHNIDERIEPL